MKKLEDMSLEELWELFPIVLTPHNNCWNQWAKEEISSLKKLLPGYYINIYHIGSTAIKDILAKPIIDIIIEMDNYEHFSHIKPILLSQGYLCMAENEKRISFNKGYTQRGYDRKVFHIHLRLKGDIDEIYFRNYLNLHQDIAKKYEQLKLSIWKKFEHDREGYTNAKFEFVSLYTKQAKLENSKIK